MKIQVDEDGKTAIIELCDIALKHGGIRTFEGISKVLRSIKVTEKTPAPPPDEDENENTTDNPEGEAAP